MGVRQFERYLQKVFDWATLLRGVPEARHAPQHSCQKVLEAVVLGAALQIGSVHRLEWECGAGALAQRIGPVSEDTIRYALQRVAPTAVFELVCAIARRLKRNGVLRTEGMRGLIVAAVDGIEICHSRVRCCERCLERTVERQVEGSKRAEVQYYHRLVAVVVVSTPFPIPLGIRFLAPGESEVNCALVLLRDLVAQLGRRFVDVVVGDALYFGTPFVEALEALGLEWVFTVKDNQPDLLREVTRLTQGPPLLATGPHEEIQRWHLPDVQWLAADRSVRIVKTMRRTEIRRQAVEQADGHRTVRRVPHWETQTTLCASSLSPMVMPAEMLEDVARSRWRIDTEVFQTLTTQCALKRPSVHQGQEQAWVVLTMLRVLAYTLLLVFYHRQVLSHARRGRLSLVELARQLLHGVLREGADTS